MAIPIAAILAAASLIQQGVGKIGEKRKLEQARRKQLYNNYVENALATGARAGGDTHAGAYQKHTSDLNEQYDNALREVEDRPVDYGNIASLISGTTGALGGKQPTNNVRIAGPEIAPASATPEGDGVISTQRIQAPLIISGPDRKPGSRGGIDDDDEDWFGNYA